MDEYKQSLVQQAVTGQIDVRTGRPYPAYRGADVGSVSAVPAHWSIRRLKTVCQIRYGLGQPPPESPDGLPLIRATNVTRGHITETGMIYVNPAAVPDGRQAILEEGEIVVVRSGAYTADSAIVTREYAGAVTGYDMVVKVLEGEPRFVAMALLCRYLRDEQLIVQSTRSAQPHLNAEELGSALLMYPPVTEQQSIIGYLANRTRTLELVARRYRRQIELVREYRTRLIADAVTGKLDVREAAAALPDLESDADGVEFKGGELDGTAPIT